jgi:hypothetical protein
MNPKAKWHRDNGRGYGFVADVEGTHLRVTATRIVVGERSYPRMRFDLVNLFDAMAFAEEKAQGE